jgi:hypothetical protein
MSTLLMVFVVETEYGKGRDKNRRKGAGEDDNLGTLNRSRESKTLFHSSTIASDQNLIRHARSSAMFQ